MPELSWLRLPRGEVCTQGAHAVRWSAADGRDVLFVSSKCRYAPGTPLRAGVPLVFPWFGDDPEGRGRPAHGFARRVEWVVDAARTDAAQGRVVLTLADDAALRAQWPHAFALTAVISLGDAFSIDLEIENRDRTPFRFEALFHTYLQVGDVRRCEVRGLHGARYHDKLDSNRTKTDGDEAIRFAGECDRTYVGTDADCVVHDPALGRTLTVHKRGAPSTVVWNPWIEKTARLADLGPDDWQRFVCVESGCVMDDAVTLAPGARHRMSLRVTVGSAM
jgi:glucose-6-phosphate 1-epimerase